MSPTAKTVPEAQWGLAMRVIIVVCISLGLGGCSTFPDLVSAYSATFDALKAGRSATETLERDVAIDFKRKSEQLEFISRGTYSCGDVNDRRAISQRINLKKGVQSVNDTTAKSLRAKALILEAIIGYGEAVANIQADAAVVKSYTTKTQNAVSTFAKLAETPEATAIATVIAGVTSLILEANKYGEYSRLYKAAYDIHPALVANINKLKDDKLGSLTASEELAFALWNACARERLVYIRDFFPPGPTTLVNANPTHFGGTTPTPVLDFAIAYGVYIGEREKFIAAKPNFSTLLDNVLAANEKIIALGPEHVLEGINDLGNAAIEANAASESARRARDSLRNMSGS